MRCGTAYFSAWPARRGAQPVGIDLTAALLATARHCQEHFRLSFPLLEADAGHVSLPGRCLDLVISEWGASLWCDPARWVPEAAWLLRPRAIGIPLPRAFCWPCASPARHDTPDTNCCAPSAMSPVCDLSVTGDSSTQVTANGSRSCAAPTSPLMYSTNCTPRQAPAPTATTSSRLPKGPAMAYRDMGHAPDGEHREQPRRPEHSPCQRHKRASTRLILIV